MNDRWWVFDKPLVRDPLFVGGVGGGIVGLVAVLACSDELGAGAVALVVWGGIPAGLLAVGATLGSIREFSRGRRLTQRAAPRARG